MFASRVAVMRTVNRLGSKDKPKRRKSEEEIELLKYCNIKHITDRDIYENSDQKLRFRKFPSGHWFMGSVWIGLTIWVLWEIHKDDFHFKHHKLLKEYSILASCLILGICFIYKGKMKHTIFDNRTRTLTIKKRNLCCDRRSMVTYKFEDITDVRAVHRGYKINGVDTTSYMIILEFENNRYQVDPNPDTDDAESFKSSSEEEDQEYENLRKQLKIKDDKEQIKLL